MKKSMIYFFTLAMICVMSGIASSGDDFGIPSYPGAKMDAETQAICAEPGIALFREREAKAGLKSAKHCYRTKDTLAKVVEFYKKQKGLKGDVGINEGDIRNASFCLDKGGGCNEVSVCTTVQIEAPWFVPKTFKTNNDLLIIVTNRVKK